MRKIGKFVITGMLGRGGMAKVYKVRAPITGNTLALKRLDPRPELASLLGSTAIERLFVEEAVIMTQMRHPHIVAARDLDHDRGRPFFVMDYFSHSLGTLIGETYQTDSPSRILPIHRALAYTDQILSGLACLHYWGVVHRDIKPYNILVDEHDAAKIGDFGLSKNRGETIDGPPNLKVGSPWYAAPEQVRQPSGVDVRADLYPVGVMFYRMLTGKLPPQPVPADAFSRINPDLDRSWDRFAVRSLADKTQQRFSSAVEMQAALHELRSQWRQQTEASCRFVVPSDSKRPSGDQTRHRLRGEGLKFGPKSAQRILPIDGLWQPRQYIQNRFTTKTDDTIFDQATGLLWQRKGSPYPLTWPQAAEYIKRINAEAVGGRDEWQLPTAEELLSLLTQLPRAKDLCIAPLFDDTQRWLWSVDRRSFTSAWYVSMDLGYVGGQAMDGYCYARGVCRTP